MSIHTFGDSHSMFGWRDIPNIKFNWLGPILCYSFGRDKLSRLNIKNYNVAENDTVIFCFGEIDCRCHVYKHITPENNYQKIIDNIVDKYFEAINENISQYKNLKVYVYNVVPSVEKEQHIENIEYPFLGDNNERKEFTLYFNSKIKENCLKYNYNFFDIYDKYTNEKGFLNSELSDGSVHIKNSIYIEQFLNL
jgi:hypothetical protein